MRSIFRRKGSLSARARRRTSASIGLIFDRLLVLLKQLLSLVGKLFGLLDALTQGVLRLLDFLDLLARRFPHGSKTAPKVKGSDFCRDADIRNVRGSPASRHLPRRRRAGTVQ